MLYECSVTNEYLARRRSFATALRAQTGEERCNAG